MKKEIISNADDAFTHEKNNRPTNKSLFQHEQDYFSS